MRAKLTQQAERYLHTLCIQIPTRSVGSAGNRTATRFFANTVAQFGFATRSSQFDCLDWREAGAGLRAGEATFAVTPSPYALGCQVEAPLLVISNVAELATATLKNHVLLLHGAIAKGQLMPKNFVFYNPVEHQEIVRLLEAGNPAAIITATGNDPGLAGGLSPFPMFEDGDFNIPSVFMTEAEGKRLAGYAGQTVRLEANATRLPAHGYNVVAQKGASRGSRIVVTAHIDAKLGTPGALDNGTGVGVLLLLAELLQDYMGPHLVELVAFNGEDYYAASGQMLYLHENEGRLADVVLNINIDGAGYREGKTAVSLYNCPPFISEAAAAMQTAHPHLLPGPLWHQGDHMIFVQQGIPAMALTSEKAEKLFTNITHTPQDTVELVNFAMLAEIALGLSAFIKGLPLC